MPTKKDIEDLQKIKAALDKLIQASFKKLLEDISVDIKEVSATNREYGRSLNEYSKELAGYGAGLKRIEKKLDRFMDLLEKFSKRQNILEAKMMLIEDYFDPHPRN